MDIQLKQVTIGEKEILKNLLEKYEYEFTQYSNIDVNDLGLYGYDYLDYYWTEDNRFAYFIKVDGKLAGFVMISNYPEDDSQPMDYCLSEFFVMHKYRRMGVGKSAVFKVLDIHKGKWQLKRHPKNIPSVHFWNNTISEYTNGNFKLIEGFGGIEYEDGTPSDILYFEN